MSRATNDPRRTGRPAAVVDAVAPQPQLDYYLILSPATGVPSTADVEGIVVEEVVRGDDCATVGLNSAGWTAGRTVGGVPPRSAGGCAPIRSWPGG